MKKWLSILLTVLLLCTLAPQIALSASARSYSGSCGADGDNLMWTLDTETGTLTITGNGAMKNYNGSGDYGPWYFKGSDKIISVEIGSGVTSIGNYAFTLCDHLSSATIPNSVTRIGNQAFLGCALESVSIPSSVTEIGSSVFCACKLTSIVIPDSVTSMGTNVFANCTALTSATVGNGVETLDGTFDGCTSLANVIIGNGVKWIVDTFYDCTSLVNVTIPDSVTRIGSQAFFNCSALQNVIIPDSVNSIESHAFENCTSLENLTIPDSVTSIGEKAFFGCCSLGRVDIGKGLRNMSAYAFENCIALESITLPDGLTEISYCAFRNCTSLTSVTIPDSVLYIWGSFLDCPNLLQVTIPRATTILDYSFGYLYDNNNSTYYQPIYVKMDNFTMCGYKNTDAQRYAQENRFTFIPLDAAPDPCANGHTPGEAVRENETAATCTEAGGYDTVVYCAVCGAELSRAHTEQGALGHLWDEGVVTVEPTELFDGERTFTCTRCKQTRTEVIPKTDHEHVFEASVTPPTCTEQGYTTYTCTVCGYSFADNYTPPAGHKFENGVCTVCGAKDPDGKPGENPFADVAADDWFATAVLWATSQDPPITSGTDASHFSPTNKCTRAEIVQFLWNAAGKPEISSVASDSDLFDENPFVDVHETDWFYKAVIWAVANGVSKGTDATHFSPMKKCTRAEVVMFLWNAADNPAIPAGTKNPFADVPYDAWYLKAVLWAVSKGITSGTDATHFAPTKVCTRAEVVQFLYKATQTK